MRQIELVTAQSNLTAPVFYVHGLVLHRLEAVGLRISGALEFTQLDIIDIHARL